MDTISTKIQHDMIGKEPVVVVPLKQWEALEDRLEDFEMSLSRSFRKKVAKARGEKTYTSAEAKKLIGI